MLPTHMASLKVTRKSDGESHTMMFNMDNTAQETFDRVDAANPGEYEFEITILRSSDHHCPEMFELHFAMLDLGKIRRR